MISIIDPEEHVAYTRLEEIRVMPACLLELSEIRVADAAASKCVDKKPYFDALLSLLSEKIDEFLSYEVVLHDEVTKFDRVLGLTYILAEPFEHLLAVVYKLHAVV